MECKNLVKMKETQLFYSVIKLTKPCAVRLVRDDKLREI